MAVSLNCRHLTVQRILQDLGYRKQSAKKMSHQIKPTLKYRSVDVCSELLSISEADEQNFFQILWLKMSVVCISMTPRLRGSRWRRSTLRRPKNFKSQRSAAKVLTFWDEKRAICWVFLNVVSELYIALRKNFEKTWEDKSLRKIFMPLNCIMITLGTNQCLAQIRCPVVLQCSSVQWSRDRCSCDTGFNDTEKVKDKRCY